MATPIDTDRPSGTKNPMVEHRRLRRRNRLLFVAGLLLIAVPGGLWAGLTKDPIRGQGQQDVFFDRGFAEEPAVFFEDDGFFPPPTPAPVPLFGP